MKGIGDLHASAMETGQPESNACSGLVGRVISLLQAIAGETMPDETAAIARERIAQAAVLHPGACLADFVSHLSGEAALSPFLSRLNGNLLQGADFEAFFSMGTPNGRVH
ncbi:MAG: hypothetical protein KAX55_04300 [Propionivibrio sp.]|nr:hypothetical protein [Propionivibrio sp.]